MWDVEVVCLLEGFEVVNFGNLGAYASVTKNGVTFNKVSFEKMNSANYVTLHVNRELKQFAVKACTPSDVNAMPFGAAIKAKAPSVRWSSKEFLHMLESMMSWDLESCKGYKVFGEFFKSEKVLLFDLTKAVPIT